MYLSIYLLHNQMASPHVTGNSDTGDALADLAHNTMGSWNILETVPRAHPFLFLALLHCVNREKNNLKSELHIDIASALELYPCLKIFIWTWIFQIKQFIHKQPGKKRKFKVPY